MKERVACRKSYRERPYAGRVQTEIKRTWLRSSALRSACFMQIKIATGIARYSERHFLMLLIRPQFLR